MRLVDTTSQAAHGLVPPPPGSSSSVFDQSLDSIVTTVKWIIGSAAVVLAVLVAGLQVSQLGGLSAGRRLLALAAYLVAVVAVGWILVRAARVLIKPGLTLSDLVNRELRASQRAVQAAGGDLARVRPADHDPLLASISRRRRELMPGPSDTDALQDFYATHMALERAWQNLTVGRDAVVAETTYQAGKSSDELALRGRLDESLARTDRLIEAAHLYIAKREYRRLVRCLVVAGVVVVLAVPTFALATQQSQALSEPPVRQPVRATVLLNVAPGSLENPSHAPASCKSRRMTGTAVGGTFVRPIVVITAPTSCRGARVHVTPDVGVAIPSVRPPSPCASG